MPIRFRCAYCNQLLGIARRKAGTIVRCPTCAGQIVVPVSDVTDDHEEPDKNGGADDHEEPEKNGGTGLFEQSDFEDVFRAGSEPSGSQANEVLPASGDSPVAAPAVGPPAGAWGTHAEPAYDMERLPFSSSQVPRGVPIVQRPGWSLSRRELILVVIGFACGAVLAFGAGLWLGYVLWSNPLGLM